MAHLRAGNALSAARPYVVIGIHNTAVLLNGERFSKVIINLIMIPLYVKSVPIKK